ncbi:MAG: methyltransferase domain-containing protein [Mesorhizobium sp.]
MVTETGITKAVGAYTDQFRFLRQWIANPLTVSAVAPSSVTLGRLMTSEISPATGPVIELGPGTGVFTRALLARGLRESDLTLIEFGADFAAMLQQRFPLARVLRMDAARLTEEAVFEAGTAGAVVSGLPLLSIPADKVAAIVAGCFRALRPSAGFYQFTYGPRCPVPRPVLDELGLDAVRIGGTLRNLPPAAVYRITRRKA